MAEPVRAQPTCPKCNKEIDHLYAFVVETNKYEIYLEEDLFPDSGHTGLNWGRAEPTEGSELSTEFCCPECGEAIFSDVKVDFTPFVVGRVLEKDSALVVDVKELAEGFLKGAPYEPRCPHNVPKEFRGRTNVCLAGGPKTKDYPGGQFCRLLEPPGKCKLE